MVNDEISVDSIVTSLPSQIIISLLLIPTVEFKSIMPQIPKEISSTAKSFPQVPFPLFFSIRTTSDWPVKETPNSFHFNVLSERISPVFSL
ncbi:hypothetical protein D3C80_1312050 [compost metagenome]